jgi:hypothetical protein
MADRLAEESLAGAVQSAVVQMVQWAIYARRSTIVEAITFFSLVLCGDASYSTLTYTTSG